MKNLISIIALLFFTLGVQAQAPKNKQTNLGLYVTAAEAIEKYRQDMDNVKVLDVRTPAEYAFVGHASMAFNVPFKHFAGFADDGKMRMTENESFVEDIKARFEKSDIILIMCRSGGRSSAAVDKLAEAGFDNAYTIIDGFEGDKLKMPGAANDGRRVVNGWKNSGGPWTYDADAKLVYKAGDK